MSILQHVLQLDKKDAEARKLRSASQLVGKVRSGDHFVSDLHDIAGTAALSRRRQMLS